MTREQWIDQRTQELVCHQIGELVLAAARRRAEAELAARPLTPVEVPAPDPPLDA